VRSSCSAGFRTPILCSPPRDSKILADLGPAEQYEAEQAAAWLAAHP
jgi:hypothetical protein